MFGDGWRAPWGALLGGDTALVGAEDDECAVSWTSPASTEGLRVSERRTRWRRGAKETGFIGLDSYCSWMLLGRGDWIEVQQEWRGKGGEAYVHGLITNVQASRKEVGSSSFLKER